MDSTLNLRMFTFFPTIPTLEIAEKAIFMVIVLVMVMVLVMFIIMAMVI